VAVLHPQERQSDLPVEPHAASGAWVHPEHTLSLGDERLMAVPVHDYPRVRARRGVDQPVTLEVHVHPQRQPEMGELAVIVPDHIRNIVRRTREYLENTLDPQTNEPDLKPVAVRLFGERDDQAVNLPPTLQDAYVDAEGFCLDRR